MVEFGTSSAFRGWARVRVLGYGCRVRGRKVKSRDCALASDLVRAHFLPAFRMNKFQSYVLPILEKCAKGIFSAYATFFCDSAERPRSHIFIQSYEEGTR